MRIGNTSLLSRLTHHARVVHARTVTIHNRIEYSADLLHTVLGNHVIEQRSESAIRRIVRDPLERVFGARHLARNREQHAVRIAEIPRCPQPADRCDGLFRVSDLL